MIRHISLIDDYRHPAGLFQCQGEVIEDAKSS
jgi:hypothetical protein